VLVLFHELPKKERSGLLRRLRALAIGKSLAIVDAAKAGTVRVHDLRELRRALLARASLILLSPIHVTRSHPEWQALPLMRAATFARLGGRELFALGGMDERRFRRIQRLGFIGWAGIDAFRT
jgi:thiamine-phosphate pyrophosphorylase